MGLSKWSEMAEAFNIFAKYSNKDSSYDDTYAEHDVIYAGPKPEEVSEEDKKRLDELGWHPSEGYPCWLKFT